MRLEKFTYSQLIKHLDSEPVVVGATVGYQPSSNLDPSKHLILAVTHQYQRKVDCLNLVGYD